MSQQFLLHVICVCRGETCLATEFGSMRSTNMTASCHMVTLVSFILPFGHLVRLLANIGSLCHLHLLVRAFPKRMASNAALLEVESHQVLTAPWHCTPHQSLLIVAFRNCPMVPSNTSKPAQLASGSMHHTKCLLL